MHSYPSTYIVFLQFHGTIAQYYIPKWWSISYCFFCYEMGSVSEKKQRWSQRQWVQKTYQCGTESKKYVNSDQKRFNWNSEKCNTCADRDAKIQLYLDEHEARMFDSIGVSEVPLQVIIVVESCARPLRLRSFCSICFWKHKTYKINK